MSATTTPPPNEERSPGQIAQAISADVVGTMRHYTGRGPTQARTTVADDHVLVVLRGFLLRAEQQLIAAGDAEPVMIMRRRFQAAMEDDLRAVVERHTGRRVHAFLSDNRVDPDVAVEVFVLEPT